MFELYVGLPYVYESLEGEFSSLEELLEYAEGVELAPDEEMYYHSPADEWVDL